MTNQELGITEVSREKIMEWHRAANNVERVKEQLKQAQRRLAEATDTMGAFITPPDAKPGEVFNIWFGSGLIQVVPLKQEATLDYQPRFAARWRTEPSSKQLSDMN